MLIKYGPTEPTSRLLRPKVSVGDRQNANNEEILHAHFWTCASIIAPYIPGIVDVMWLSQGTQCLACLRSYHFPPSTNHVIPRTQWETIRQNHQRNTRIVRAMIEETCSRSRSHEISEAA